MQINVSSNFRLAALFLADVHKRHVPFATILAATTTANEVKSEEISTMRRVFDRPTPYVLNAIASRPATRDKPVASVDFDKSTHKGTPAKRFLNPNIHGGPRSQKSHEKKLAGHVGALFMVPGKDAKTNAYGNVNGSHFTRILSQLKVSSDQNQNATGSKRSKRGRKNSAFFISKNKFVLHRQTTGKGKDRKDNITVWLVPVKAPTYTKRFPFYDVAQATVQRKFPDNFTKALDRAIATSNYKGKWK